MIFLYGQRIPHIRLAQSILQNKQRLSETQSFRRYRTILVGWNAHPMHCRAFQSDIFYPDDQPFPKNPFAIYSLLNKIPASMIHSSINGNARKDYVYHRQYCQAGIDRRTNGRNRTPGGRNRRGYARRLGRRSINPFQLRRNSLRFVLTSLKPRFQVAFLSIRPAESIKKQPAPLFQNVQAAFHTLTTPSSILSGSLYKQQK